MFSKLILFLVMLLWCSGAWATYPNYTVCPSGCDFSTLEGAVADLIANHPTPAGPVTIVISGSWASADTSVVNISGITTTSSNTLTISTTGSAVNNGKLPTGSGGYWLAPTSSSNPITLSNNYVTISGIAIDMSTGSGGAAILIGNYYTNIKLNGLVLKGSSVSQGIDWENPRTASNYVYNCVGYGFTNGSPFKIVNGDGSTVSYVYNNTSYNNYYGFNMDNGASGSDVYFSNNVASSNSHNSIQRPDRLFAGSHNVCDDGSSCTTSPLTSGTNNATSYTSYYTSPSGGDFSLKSGSILIGGGTSESGTFTTDITGAARQASGAWDVGAFKFGSNNHTDIIQGNSIIRGNSIIN